MSDTGLLGQVFEGMKVFDSTGDEIGKVDLVQMGDPEAATPASPVDDRSPFLAGLFSVRGDEERDLPPSIRERYQLAGFFRVDGKGWLDTDRYVAADQIAEVVSDTVRLNVPKEDLIEA
jgi:hypothetical protein